MFPAVAKVLKISVIVPSATNPAHPAHVVAVVVQKYDPHSFEILVVDGESTDNTRELVQELVDRYDNVFLFHNPKRLSSAARNIGIRHARGDAVLIVDGHCEIPTDRMLENLAAAFHESGADCIGRPQPLDVTNATTLQRAMPPPAPPGLATTRTR